MRAVSCPDGVERQTSGTLLNRIVVSRLHDAALRALGRAQPVRKKQATSPAEVPHRAICFLRVRGEKLPGGRVWTGRWYFSPFERDQVQLVLGYRGPGAPLRVFAHLTAAVRE